MKNLLLTTTGLGFVALLTLPSPTWAEVSFPQALIDAANHEGHLTYYSANLPDVLQNTVAKFNQRFPGISVDIVRLANPALIARVQAEGSTGHLVADVVETTDIGDAKRMESFFDDFAPPNAALVPAAAQYSKRFWPICGAAYGLMVNTAIVKNPPHDLAGLLDPAWKGKLGTVVPGAGGTSWGMALMQRLVVGEDYWPKFATQKPMLYLSSVPLGTDVASGQISMGFAPLIAASPMIKQGAPIAMIGMDDGIPAAPTAVGVVKGAKNPNAARLFVDWEMSDDGQKVLIDLGCASVLPDEPLPPGLQTTKGKVWVPPFAEYAARQPDWIKEWNKIYNYNQ